MRSRPKSRLLALASELAEGVFHFSRREEIEQDRGMRNKLQMCSSAIDEELTEAYDAKDRDGFLDSLHRAKMWAMELEFHLRFVVTMGYAPRSEVVSYVKDANAIYHRIARIQTKLGRSGHTGEED